VGGTGSGIGEGSGVGVGGTGSGIGDGSGVGAGGTGSVAGGSTSGEVGCGGGWPGTSRVGMVMRSRYPPGGRSTRRFVNDLTGQANPMKLLLIASEVPDAKTIRGLAGTDDAEVYVVAPALEDSPLRFWVSDVDDAIARARQVQEQAVAGLRDAGVAATGDVGEAEPLQAAQDALALFPADRVLVLTHDDDDRAYREDELDAARRRLGVPVQLQRVERTAS
jgi:hypothetical protein